MVCSRNTVRGALSLLAHDKIVDLQPNRGAFVHVPDLKEMKDVFNTRIEMESMILSVLIDMPDLETRLQPLYAMIEQEGAASESATAWVGTACPMPSMSNWRGCWTTMSCLKS